MGFAPPSVHVLLNDQVVKICIGFSIKTSGWVLHIQKLVAALFPQYWKRNKFLVCFYFFQKCMHLWTLVLLSQNLHTLIAVPSTRSGGVFSTIFYSTSRRLNWFSAFSRSYYFNCGCQFGNNFAKMGRRNSCKPAIKYPCIGWVYFGCALW